jgi:hypothetical protein
VHLVIDTQCENSCVGTEYSDRILNKRAAVIANCLSIIQAANFENRNINEDNSMEQSPSRADIR